MSDFDSKRDGTGTMEWAEVTENIQLGCANNCIYCYAAYNADRFRRRQRKDWAREELTKRAEMRSYPAKDGIIMFPSSHDITPYNVDAFCRISKMMLSAGNRLLIVSKPRPECISRVCGELSDHKDKILFRFTIGTMVESVRVVCEPNAPSMTDRVWSLADAKNQGFRTSVSAEPLLGGYDTAKRIIKETENIVTDTIWIGKINKGALRIYPKSDANTKMLKEIEEAQSDSEVLRMVKDLSGPKIRWKDSINQVIERNKTSN